MMLRRLDAGESPDFSADVFEDLAKAAGVSAQWLQSGRGSPHEGRGDEARAFLAARRETFAGGEHVSPDAWLAHLRDGFRAWRSPAKVVGEREISDDDDARLPKVNPRRR